MLSSFFVCTYNSIYRFYITILFIWKSLQNQRNPPLKRQTIHFFFKFVYGENSSRLSPPFSPLFTRLLQGVWDSKEKVPVRNLDKISPIKMNTEQQQEFYFKGKQAEATKKKEDIFYVNLLLTLFKPRLAGLCVEQLKIFLRLYVTIKMWRGRLHHGQILEGPL